MQNILHQGGDLPPDGRAGRQAGGFDARAVHKAGGGFPDEKLVPQFVGAQPRKAGDGLPQRQVLHGPACFGAHLVQFGGGGGGVLFVVDVGGRGADEQVAVDRGGHQHAFAVLARQLEHRMPHMVPGGVVQQEVIPPAGHDGHGVGADLVVQFVGMHARRVDHAARLQRAAAGLHPPAARDGPHGLHLGIELEAHAVFGGVLGKGAGQAKGADDAAGGGPQRSHRLVGDVRLQGAQFAAFHDAQPLHAVGQTVLIEFLQRRAVLIAQADHQAAALVVGKIQLFGKGRHHAAARHVQGGHAAACGGVEPGVDDGAVGLAGAAADVLLLVQYQNVRPEAAQFPGGGAAADPRADDDDVDHTVPSSSSRAQP